MMDMSVFESLKEGQEKRGWLMTDIQVFCLQTHKSIFVTNFQTPTSVLGRCPQLQYSMAGLNVEVKRGLKCD